MIGYLASNALIGFVGNPELGYDGISPLFSRFQCVNWICWKHVYLDRPANARLARFQCVNWICWKLATLLVSWGFPERLASNALIGLVGNTPANDANLERAHLASNALIGLVGNGE